MHVAFFGKIVWCIWTWWKPISLETPSTIQYNNLVSSKKLKQYIHCRITITILHTSIYINLYKTFIYHIWNQHIAVNSYPRTRQTIRAKNVNTTWHLQKYPSIYGDSNVHEHMHTQVNMDSLKSRRGGGVRKWCRNNYL